MNSYTHEIHYYETDKMGIVHHSNYIRWMEEARTHFLEAIGYGYKAMEDNGIVSPVISVNGEFKRTTTYGDKVNIVVTVLENRGVKVKIKYVMTNVDTGEICFIGESTHAFLTAEGRPISIKKQMPEFYELLNDYLEVDN